MKFFRIPIFLILFGLVIWNSAYGETIEWSGYKWRVRTSEGKPQGPGPNIFEDTKENAYVDSNGNLHLKIVQNNKGEWVCAEVSMTESLGYGTYEWELASRYDKLAKNAVLGLFTYISPESVAKQTGHKTGDKIADTPHEIDIEFTGAWGGANLFYTTHDPDTVPPNKQFYQSLTGDYTTHRFTWYPERIHWESFHGHVAGQKSPENAIVEQRDIGGKGNKAEFDYSGPVVPKDLNEKAIMNFWIFDDKSSQKRPSDGKPQEAIIHSFHFTPLKTP